MFISRSPAARGATLDATAHLTSERHDMSTIYQTLVIDIVAIGILAYGIYRRRHAKGDLAVAFVVLNVGVFGAVCLLANSGAGIALGMGLFGILSIIRLRSTQITQTEVAYYFVALVLGLVNALGAGLLGLTLALNAILITALAVLDKAVPKPCVLVQRVVLDAVYPSALALRVDVEARLGQAVAAIRTEEIDYVREVTTVSVDIEQVAQPCDEHDSRRVGAADSVMTTSADQR